MPDAASTEAARSVRAHDTDNVDATSGSPVLSQNADVVITSNSGCHPDPDSQSSGSSSDIHDPRSPSFSPPSSAEAILRSLSPQPRPPAQTRKPSLKKYIGQSTTQPLSPERLPLRPPTPPVISVKVTRTDESDDTLVSEPSPCDRSRTVRFKPRVRISSGIHHDHPHGDIQSISHSSSFSDSSSISAPLRPPAEEHIRPTPNSRRLGDRSSLDGTFTADDFNAWLARSGLNHDRDEARAPSGPIEAWDDAAEETTALMAHRRRRRALESRGGRGGQAKGPPNYIAANRGLQRSPMPSTTSMKLPGSYGTLVRPEDEDEGSDSDRFSHASSKAENSVILGAWSAGWSGGWNNTQSWWSRFKTALCCGYDPDDRLDSN
ncbi:hypothetical protein FRB94_001551 [Tulasnella sp. JGI-2019a]|nr:hypothetical protein FRB93_012515 [Tulasnella sp. JGI-2019a]KAG9005466.1 hypothetical protein FRB94_001551 [Tulasnella sp. JGI-2019a]KAG9028984.1 hypothetical protein FRB95_005852 [Tulasnella sp. JGI-2019a]